jgi:hypothetical protein
MQERSDRQPEAAAFGLVRYESCGIDLGSPNLVAKSQSWSVTDLSLVRLECDEHAVRLALIFYGGYRAARQFEGEPGVGRTACQKNAMLLLMMRSSRNSSQYRKANARIEIADHSEIGVDRPNSALMHARRDRIGMKIARRSRATMCDRPTLSARSLPRTDGVELRRGR